MTRDQAIQRCNDAGIPTEDITEADLKSAGYEAPDPTQAMPANPPAVTDDQVTQDNAAAQTEAQSNTTGAQVLQAAEKAAGIAGTLLGKVVVS